MKENMSEKKTAVVIPGSTWQIPLIKKLKSMGHRTLVVNPYPNSPAFRFADGYLQADIFNDDAVLNYCRQEQVEAILSDECDIAMPVLAKYGKALGLPVLSESTASLFTNKLEMRKFGELHGLPMPEYRICFNLEQAIEFYQKINQKMILKPLDSNSSRGIYTIDSVGDIQTHYAEALAYSRVEKAVLMERYIEGAEFTIDGIKTPDRHYSLAVSEKRHFKHNHNIASELYFTHENSNFDYDLLRRTNDAFVNATNLQYGLTHAEYKYENGIFYLIEIAARGGGNLISSHIVPYITGIDNYKYLIECSFGNITAPNFSIPKEYRNKTAILKFFETPQNGGIVQSIDGEDFLKNNSAIMSYCFNFQLGDCIEPATNDATRIGFYIACCDTAQELNYIIKQISENVCIRLSN